MVAGDLTEWYHLNTMNSYKRVSRSIFEGRVFQRAEASYEAWGRNVPVMFPEGCPCDRAEMRSEMY